MIRNSKRVGAQAQEMVCAIRNNGLHVGEMTAEDMAASMLHPENRRLEVLTIGDAEAAAKSIQMLMGTEVEPRRDFLFENVDFSILNN